MATALEPEKVTAFLDRIADYQLAVAHRHIELGIDIGHMGDEIGTTKALFMLPEVWRTLTIRLCVERRLVRTGNSKTEDFVLFSLPWCNSDQPLPGNNTTTLGPIFPFGDHLVRSRFLTSDPVVQLRAVFLHVV